MDGKERVYTSKEVCSSVGVATSTLRKWSIELEKESYNFTKDEHNRRMYKENDITAFRNLKELLATNVKLEHAIKSIAIKYGNNKITPIATEKTKNIEVRSEQRQLVKLLIQEIKNQRTEIQDLKNKSIEREAFEQMKNELRDLKNFIQEQKEKKKWYQFWK